MLLGYDIQTLIFIAITFVVAISLHEFAHARTADKLGDPTPRMQGRVTPNPLRHIDPFGFILIFIIQFGRGRPVQINPNYFKNPLRDELLVAIAGPAMNIALAVFGILITILITSITGIEQIIGDPSLLYAFWSTFAYLNIVLAVFNMLPIPPLDGYRIITYLFPSTQRFFIQYGKYIGLGLLAVILIPNPIGDLLGTLIQFVTRAIYAIVAFPLDALFL